MKKAIVVLLAAAIAVGGASAWLLYSRMQLLAAIPPQALETERALALPGLLALATVNVAGLVELQGVEGSGARQDDDSWPARLARAGVDLRTDVSHATAAVYAREEGAIGVAFGLFGELAPVAIERALRRDPQFEVKKARIAGQPVLQVTVTDRESCEPSGPWAVHLARNRLLIGDADSLEAILGRLERSQSAGRDLSRFQDFRHGMLASAAVFVPEELPGGIGDPWVAMSAQSVKGQLEGFRALYLGAGARVVPPGLRLASVLEAEDPGTAGAAARRWRDALARSKEGWAEKLPTVAALYDALEIAAEGRELSLEARLGKDAAEQLENLPSELIGLLFGGFGDMVMTAQGGAPAEQIDENPIAFAARQRVEDLPPYDPERLFAGPADKISGPFGFRLASIALPEDPDAGPVIAIEAVGAGIPNLGRSVERAQLMVTGVASHRGEELLAEQVCGPDRNDLPVAFEPSGLGVLTATKRVRLRPDAGVEEIARIAGHVRLRMPVGTETVRLTAPAKGEVVERAGARLELTDVGQSSVSWRLSGETSRFLHLRALNADGQPLAIQGGGSMDSLFGGGKLGSTSFAGKVAHLEAVFAVEEELWEYPVHLTDLHPGTDGEHLASREVEFVPFPLAKLAGELERVVERAVDGADAPVTAAAAGPFTVTLEGVWAFGGLMPHFEVQAPQIPNLEESLSGLEFALDEIHLRDGTVHQRPGTPEDGAWTQLVALRSPFGEPFLAGDVQLQTGAPGGADQVARLRGRLVLRMPQRVATWIFDEYELGASMSSAGLSLTIAEIGRDRFTLRASAGGERVLAVRAFNSGGEELSMTGASAERTTGGWRGEFQVSGIPARLEVIVAEGLDTAEYPFALALDTTGEAQRANAVGGFSSGG